MERGRKYRLLVFLVNMFMNVNLILIKMVLERMLTICLAFLKIYVEKPSRTENERL